VRIPRRLRFGGGGSGDENGPAVLAKGEPRRRFLTFRNGYHGDTFGAMSVCDPDNSMHSLWQGYLPDNLFAPAPQSRFGGEWDERDMVPFARLMAAHRDEIAVILEPVVQGAGGMRMYHPEWLKRIRKMCDREGILLIADEIATGFGRTGKLFACEHAGIAPDILCLGKALTGGTMTLSATLTTRPVAETISNGEAGCLCMARPLWATLWPARWRQKACGCWKAANGKARSPRLKRSLMSSWLRPGIPAGRRCPRARRHRRGGNVPPGQYGRAAALLRRTRVWIRPFGRLIYLMPPYVITPQQLTRLTEAVNAAVLNDTFFRE
jgi:adenosylmethionine-8-amino-7-oxononanoate aminotransferase